jgi:hypothetical protein
VALGKRRTISGGSEMPKRNNEVVVDPEAMVLTDAQRWQMTEFILDNFWKLYYKKEDGLPVD